MSTTDLVSKDPVLHTVETNPSNDDVECLTCSFLSFPVITALQGTQCETKESIKDIFHGLLNNTSLGKLVWMNIRERLIWKDVKQAQQNQLWSADDYVKIKFIGKLTVGNGE